MVTKKSNGPADNQYDSDNVQKTSHDCLFLVFKDNTYFIEPTLDDIITHRLPLSQIAHGYKIFKEKQEDCVKVVLNPWAA